MKQSLSLSFIALLVISSAIPSGSVFADSEEGVEYTGRQESVYQGKTERCDTSSSMTGRITFDYTFKVMPDGIISGKGTYSWNNDWSGDMSALSGNGDGNVKIDGFVTNKGDISSASRASIMITPEFPSSYYGPFLNSLPPNPGNVESIIEETKRVTPEPDNPQDPSIELKPGFKRVIEGTTKWEDTFQFPSGEDCFIKGENSMITTDTISGPPIKFLIKGKISSIDRDSKTIPLPESIVVLGNYDYMKKNGELLARLSDEQTFELKKTSQQDGTYEFTSDEMGSETSVLPKLVITSLLWYDGEGKFAITNGDLVDGRRIPLYQAICIEGEKDDTSRIDTDCIKWKKIDESHYEAEVNFDYGNSAIVDKQSSFMNEEDWKPASATNVVNLMRDAGVVYYNSYKAMKYFESIKGPAGISNLSPVTIQIREKSDPLCQPTPEHADGAGAFYRIREQKSFGGLGTYLERVTTDATIYLCDKRSAFNIPDAPVNREYHEFGHYLQEEMYKPVTRRDQQPFKSHAGYNNPGTNDSLTEGFASFAALLIDQYYSHADSALYAFYKGVLNIEEDYKVWSPSYFLIATNPPAVAKMSSDFSDEEWAIAGILWDFHDKGTEINIKYQSGVGWVDISKAYPGLTDKVSLSGEEILRIITDKKPLTLVDLHNAFSQTVPKDDVDMIFISHGAFDDTIDRNLIHDTGEKAGPTGSSSEPDRKERYSPKPGLPSSFIIADTDATFQINIKHEEPYGNYDFSYQVNMVANEPAYFEMPPSYYPSRAVFNQMSDDKVVVPEAIVIDSSEYWEYIMSEPKEDAIFKTIPAKQVTLTTTENSNEIPTTDSPAMSPTVKEEVEQNTAPSSDGGGGCLIATAAFGSEMAPQVQMLRETRDNVVMKTQSGAAFMTAFNSIYYTFAPIVADWEQQNPIFKEMVKTAITPLITTLSILNYVEIDSEAKMVSYGIGIILLNLGMYFVMPAIIILKARTIRNKF